jgi:hypothetical protein
MNKILVYALVIAISVAFVFPTVQAPAAGSMSAAGYACPNVGWNSRMCTAPASNAFVQPVAILVRPPVSPNVGWNS